MLDPNSSKMQYWDMMTGLALVFTAFVTPFEVGTGVETKINALFVVNQLVNTLFQVDIVLQFFLPLPDPRPERSGEMIRDHKTIARLYLRSWFALDVASVCLSDSNRSISSESLGPHVSAPGVRKRPIARRDESASLGPLVECHGCVSIRARR